MCDFLCTQFEFFLNIKSADVIFMGREHSAYAGTRWGPFSLRTTKVVSYDRSMIYDFI